MRISLLTAAGLAMLLAVAHSYLGERYILIRLFRRTDLPRLFGVEFTKQTLRFAWHITSIAWLELAALLVVLGSAASGTERTHARVIASVFGLSGLAALSRLPRTPSVVDRLLRDCSPGMVRLPVTAVVCETPLASPLTGTGRRVKDPQSAPESEGIVRPR